MATLTEVYVLAADDKNKSLEIQKDSFGNIRLVFTEDGITETVLIDEEFLAQFTYVLNRIF